MIDPVIRMLRQLGYVQHGDVWTKEVPDEIQTGALRDVRSSHRGPGQQDASVREVPKPVHSDWIRKGDR